MENITEFYKGKNVLVTGHTGFKGSWLCEILTFMGANVIGYALNPIKDNQILFDTINLEKNMTSIIGDIRDYEKLLKVFNEYKPSIVLHLAAQPIVSEGYINPRETYEINVMGTVNLLECIRNTESVKSVINVTTDKVYQNNEWVYPYRENDILNGYDPYSNSKSCSELVTSSYKNSFLNNKNIAVSTVRAGNVIGGGDFATNRIIPDCVRAAIKGETIFLRNPSSVRPYQHVIEADMAYLMIAYKQYLDKSYADSYNIGPDNIDCVTTEKLVSYFCYYWGNNLKYESKKIIDPIHEAGLLKLDCSKIKSVFNWKPHYHIDEAVKKTVEWTKLYINNQDTAEFMNMQIKSYIEENKNV